MPRSFGEYTLPRFIISGERTCGDRLKKLFWWRVMIKQIRLAGAAKSMKISYVNLRFEKDIAHAGV